jgi:oligopeptide transport system permease protein
MSSKAQTRRAPHFVAPVDDAALGAIDAVRVSEKKSNLWLDAWRDLRSRPMFWISSVLIVFIIFVALAPGVFTSEPPNASCYLSAVPDRADHPENSSNGGPIAGHPMGFTKQGCDLFSRVVHGTATSLSVGLIVTALVAAMGILMGGLAGFFGGWIDSLLMRLGDIFFAIPYILAAVVVMSVFSAYRSVWVIALAIGAFAWPSTARILRSEVLRIKQSDFVMASTALGVSRLKTLATHVLPNSIAPVIVVTTVSLAAAITAEATLSFLGVGLPSSIMSWGNDISAAQNDLRTNPMTLIYPSIALSITVLSFIMLGETLRDALDPRARAVR